MRVAFAQVIPLIKLTKAKVKRNTKDKRIPQNRIPLQTNKNNFPAK